MARRPAHAQSGTVTTVTWLNMAAGGEEEYVLDREIVIEDQDEYYTLLNVSRTASPEEIRSAYRRLCKIYHPDR